MEESSELQPEENKVSAEKFPKRKLKTPAQLKGLEKFYTEHKYPTEELKLAIAEELELTEKQVSGWFCHRRLKDKRLLKEEANANGRQDRSSGVIQDRGSGLGQDSCGSSKHGDYKYLDPKEVESNGLYNRDLSVADMTYGRRNHFSENVSGMDDDTSSESSSYLQERMYPQGQDPYEMEPSRYSKALPPLNPKGAINMGYKPSGYLKVKGEIEHAAITAVKKQLGRNYQEDGPLLGVEFDPLPPGAFECQTEEAVHEPYHIADPALLNSPEISTVKSRPGLSSRYDSYYTKHGSQDTHMEGVDFGSLHDVHVQDKQDKKALHGTKHRQTFQSNAGRFPGRNSSLDLYEDSTGEAAYNITKNHRKDAKRGVEGIRSDSTSNHSDRYEENLPVKHSDFLQYNYENTNQKNVQRSVHADILQYDYDNVNPKKAPRSEHIKSKPSNSIHNSRGSVDTEERGLSSRMTKDELFKGDRKSKKQYRDAGGAGMLSNETMVAKRLKANTFQPYNMKQVPVAEIEPRKTQRSAAEMPSSFSEDETADTSSSLD
ncbi:putative transcription factor Homobox-WOX family [Medicago truncatula]|uniref:Homeobox leucine zipper protein n=2 Tax=Medicago truncatula TaxID=3880 RepID=G7K365_MEDTR|nr:homeobox-DDT domain protein RLT2 isoform X1 [Medicago truncatula]AET00237.1 homeobox leucine zipper protein [Medicago truncatula]RHN57581.1 putative transcription factor Homobox-WOX family [Medicago truncatula]